MTCFKECIMNIFLCQELFFPSILKIYIGTFYLLFFYILEHFRCKNRLGHDHPSAHHLVGGCGLSWFISVPWCLDYFLWSRSLLLYDSFCNSFSVLSLFVNDHLLFLCLLQCIKPVTDVGYLGLFFHIALGNCTATHAFGYIFVPAAEQPPGLEELCVFFEILWKNLSPPLL